jgi:hypothetical protein
MIIAMALAPSTRTGQLLRELPVGTLPRYIDSVFVGAGVTAEAGA